MNIDPHIFRAYDIRGVVKTALKPEVVTLIGQALGGLYPNSKTVVVGRDGRMSSKQLVDSLSHGLQACGCEVIDIGEVPTPVLYYATHKLNTGAGVMVTGSHNPPEYNGLKMVMDGRTLHGEDIQAIYQCIINNQLKSEAGSIKQEDLLDTYISRIAEDVKLARPLRIGVDCGNGVAGPAALTLFKQLGCEIFDLYCDVDGSFPNHHPNPSDPKNLEDLITCVHKNKLHLGLAFDGDGDRVGVVDDKGEVLWADRQMMLYSRDVLSRKPGAKIIFDVKSSRNLAAVIEAAGGEAIMWKTGHSFIKNKMSETGAELAGEMSGHIFFKERWYGFDDALYSAARLLEILAKQDLSSSDLFSTLPNSISTPEINVHFDEDGAQHVFMQKFASLVDLPDAKITTIDGIRADYQNGWGLVRASNTTPSLVIRFEADDERVIESIKNDFRQQMSKTDSNIELPF
ncbi:MAG: phosphomannomutase/phosphoglucomutase [Gammaproteobacteria bacterium]|nr:MAG: phosphomannomutase/phosphoglucomutase [Gammaproteobacteria bacterium]